MYSLSNNAFKNSIISYNLTSHYIELLMSFFNENFKNAKQLKFGMNMLDFECLMNI